jgi:SAM-dependent methyltransferase
MSTPYQVMYRIGFTPWDNHDVAPPLVDLVVSQPTGRMLDIGCGTGSDAIWCAQRGWDVTGVDAVSVPLRKARRKAQAAGVDVRFLHHDIARVAPAQLGSGFTVLQDIGCFAGLHDTDRRRAASTIDQVAAPGGRLLIFAFGPGGGSRLGPRRIELADIEPLFPGWDVEFSRPADEIEVKGPMRDAPRHWHQLRKHRV